MVSIPKNNKEPIYGGQNILWKRAAPKFSPSSPGTLPGVKKIEKSSHQLTREIGRGYWCINLEYFNLQRFSGPEDHTVKFRRSYIILYERAYEREDM